MKSILLSLWLTLVLPLPGHAAQATNSFHQLNGVMWFYTTHDGYTFKQIHSQLDDLKHRGIRIVGIYSPYLGDKEKWLGCAPFDFYRSVPETGTVDEFRELVTAAHAKDMKIITYFTNTFIDIRSDFFTKAELQYRVGDRTSKEVSAFRWTNNPREPLPKPSPGPSKWKLSQTAGAYYWSLWDEAGFDFNQAGGRAEVEKLMKFWLDTGVDGFMFDAAHADPVFKFHMVDLVKTYTSTDKWITFESTESEKAEQYAAFGLTSWFNLEDNDHVNDYVQIIRGGYTADDLERALQNGDSARAMGLMTHAWAKWETEPDEKPKDSETAREMKPYANEELMRVQEAALLAGAGITYGAPTYRSYMKWPPTLRANWERVMRTINDNKALLPSASRARVKATAGARQKVYAMKRTSQDRAQTVLLVYNFSSTVAEIKLDLRGSGVKLEQIPRDLYRGQTLPAIRGSAYNLTLPAFGFVILEAAIN